MSNAKLDENRVPTMLAVSNDDGLTTLNVLADESIKALKVSDGTGGSEIVALVNAPRDQNYKTVFWATSSVDGVTPVAVYCDTSGNLLINSN